ncbi:MAG: hemolysin III family protein [Lawsonibacter sp.]|nr:hemolysin III family protein [Lawsonibacter sp.]
MRTNTLTAVPSVSAASVLNAPHRRAREERDPYDGLRPWSAITHGAGAVLAAAGTAALLIRSAMLGRWLLFGLFAVYGLSMICLYTASTLYHCLNVSVSGRLALRKYDHCSIYLLIAGSYTPLCLTVLRSAGGLPLVIAVWVLAAAGTVLTIAKLSIPRWLTSAIYLFMGWLAIFAIVPIYHALPAAGFFWLLAGGILYTVGGVLYAVKRPGRNNPRFGCHEIFHVFILLGSIAHFVMMYQTVLLL